MILGILPGILFSLARDGLTPYFEAAILPLIFLWTLCGGVLLSPPGVSGDAVIHHWAAPPLFLSLLSSLLLLFLLP